MKKLSECKILERYGFCFNCGETYLLDNTLSTEVYCPDEKCFKRGTHLKIDVFNNISEWQKQKQLQGIF